MSGKIPNQNAVWQDKLSGATAMNGYEMGLLNGFWDITIGYKKWEKME